ncbi:unnamed protein product [Spodoptera exigua]|nr:unnamed protein product [Spodoptera exigua]
MVRSERNWDAISSFCEAVMFASKEGGGPREGAIFPLTPQPPQQVTLRASGIKGRSPATVSAGLRPARRAARGPTRTKPERTARSVPRAPQRANRPPQTRPYRADVQPGLRGKRNKAPRPRPIAGEGTGGFLVNKSLTLPPARPWAGIVI